MVAALSGPILLILVPVLLALRVPLAFALAGVATLGIALIAAGQPASGDAIWLPALHEAGSALFSSSYGLIHSADLAMVPLFVLLGNLAFYTGITTRIYDAAAVWLRPLPGGVAMASVMGCGGFAAISGSSVACASTMGRICVPDMLRLGYDPKLAAASVAAGGMLGSMIPPSIPFILYGIFTGNSIGQLFLAGILPGFLSLAGMLAVVAWWVAREPQAAPRAARGEATPVDALVAAWPAALLFGVIVGGIYSRVLDPAEAAAICVALTLGIGLAQRRLSMDVALRACRETLIQSASIFLIAGAAKLFIAFVALSGMADAFVEWIAVLDPSYFLLMLSIVLVYLVLGMFLDPMAILVLTLPFLSPLVGAYDMNAIWFGVVIVKLLEIGLITPPVGLNVFVLASVTREIGVDRIFAGVSRFLAVDLVVLAILILFPALSTLIPSSM